MVIVVGEVRDVVAVVVHDWVVNFSSEVVVGKKAEIGVPEARPMVVALENRTMPTFVYLPSKTDVTSVALLMGVNVMVVNEDEGL